MKNPLLVLFWAAFFPAVLQAQTYTLNWASSFSPLWANGQTSGFASNVGGSGINASVTITHSGGIFNNSNGHTGVATPTVSGSVFVVGNATANLEIAMDFHNNSEYTDILYQFSSVVSQVHLEIGDIDKATATSTDHFDKVIVTGSNGTASILPSITRYNSTTDANFLVIAGNEAHANTTSGAGGNSASTASDQKGTIVVDFGTSPVSSFTIRYTNASGAHNNPNGQDFAIGNVSFQKIKALPVQFIYVHAKTASRHTTLEWATASETDNAYFEVERSHNASSWSSSASYSCPLFEA